jgi:hypothetical protein
VSEARGRSREGFCPLFFGGLMAEACQLRISANVTAISVIVTDARGGRRRSRSGNVTARFGDRERRAGGGAT